MWAGFSLDEQCSYLIIRIRLIRRHWGNPRRAKINGGSSMVFVKDFNAIWLRIRKWWVVEERPGNPKYRVHTPSLKTFSRTTRRRPKKTNHCGPEKETIPSPLRRSPRPWQLLLGFLAFGLKLHWQCHRKHHYQRSNWGLVTFVIRVSGWHCHRPSPSWVLVPPWVSLA